MKAKLLTVLLALTLLSVLTALPMTAAPEIEQTVTYGPRFDNLLMKIYATVPAELLSFEASDLDILDWELTPEYVDKYAESPWKETIVEDAFTAFGINEFDLNHNETIATYPNWRSPMNYVEFRHALAHLADKDRYVAEVYKGYAVKLDRGPIWSWFGDYYNPAADAHPFSPSAAANILDAAGFTMHGDGDLRVYPSGHAKAGQKLDNLIFVIRSDKPEWTAMVDMFIPEVRALGIPVDDTFRAESAVTKPKVMINYDYHLYTGGWGVSGDPDWIFWLYHSSMYWYDGVTSSYNYAHIDDAEFDTYAYELLTPADIPSAVAACRNAMVRFQEIIGNIPLTGGKGYMAHKRPVAGTVQFSGGIDTDYTFIGAHLETQDTGGTFRYGICQDMKMLNPVYCTFTYDWATLTKIYEFFGVVLNPYSRADQSWTVESWSVGTWAGGAKHAITFNMYDNIRFHDGQPVTSEDIKFSFDLIRSLPDSWVFGWIAGDYIHHVDAPTADTVIVWADVFSAWTVHWFSSLPILPKHIWDTLTKTVTGETVGTGDGTTTEFTLFHNWEGGNPTKIGTETIYIDGSPTTAYTMEDIPPGYTAYTKTGKIIFDTAPASGAVITADYTYYDWHGFGTDLDPTLTGAGTWKFVSYAAGDAVLLSANRDWFLPVHPKGDINYDHYIDIYDIVIVGAAFGSERSQPSWDIRADLVGPANTWDLIDIYDLVKVASQFGEEWNPNTTWDTVP